MTHNLNKNRSPLWFHIRKRHIHYLELIPPLTLYFPRPLLYNFHNLSSLTNIRHNQVCLTSSSRHLNAFICLRLCPDLYPHSSEASRRVNSVQDEYKHSNHDDKPWTVHRLNEDTNYVLHDHHPTKGGICNHNCTLYVYVVCYICTWPVRGKQGGGGGENPDLKVSLGKYNHNGSRFD